MADTAAAQRPALQLRMGAVASSALADDDVASALLRQRVGAPVAASLAARPRLAPTVELALQVPVRPRVAAELAVGYARSQLRAEEQDGALWNAGDLSVLHGLLGIRWQWHPSVALSGAFGALRYAADGRALFARGDELNPGVEGALHATLPWAAGRGGVRVFAQAHRFNTPALRRAGASDGGVVRLGVQGTLRLLAGGQP